jgi:hypothetical protein
LTSARVRIGIWLIVAVRDVRFRVGSSVAKGRRRELDSLVAQGKLRELFREVVPDAEPPADSNATPK